MLDFPFGADAEIPISVEELEVNAVNKTFILIVYISSTLSPSIIPKLSKTACKLIQNSSTLGDWSEASTRRITSWEFLCFTVKNPINQMC